MDPLPLYRGQGGEVDGKSSEGKGNTGRPGGYDRIVANGISERKSGYERRTS